MKVASQENLALSPNAKRLTDNLSRKVNYFSFGFNMTEEKVAPHFYVPRSRVEENSAKNRGFATAGETPANGEGTQSSGIPKTSDRRFFGTSGYGVGFRRPTSLIFWERVQPTV